MPTSRPAARSSSMSLSSFHSTFREAILTYNKRTKNDLLFHPLAPLFQSCNDPAVALSLLQRHAQQSPQPRISDEQLKSMLTPTLNGLYAISSSDGEGVGLVLVDSYPIGRSFNGVFSGIIAGESYLSCHWHPPFGEDLP